MLLALRSTFWALALPGVFGVFIPWRYFGLAQVSLDTGNPVHLLGLAVVITGAILLTICIVEFARVGRGTLSPLDPPTRLVVRGLYRYVRNPMYLSVTLIVFGEVLLTRSTGLLAYWVVWFLTVNLFVMGYEEPTLREQFGGDYEEYSRTVGRWLPRFR